MTVKGYIKNSISRQLCLTIIGLVAGNILLCVFINSTFLDAYYSARKTASLMRGYGRVNTSIVDDNVSDTTFAVRMDQMCARENIEMLIISGDGSVVYSSSGNKENLVNQFMNVLFGGQSDDDRKMVKTTDNYSIQQIVDDRISSKYLVLWGTLDDGNLLMMRTTFEGMRESVDIANRFLLYIGMFTVLFSALIIVYVSEKIARPVVQMTQISKKMTELDFTAKYEADPDSMTELDILGQHMNQLSEKLESTISELKTANNELKKDIERKEQIDEMRKEFLSNVSHELKTPLALIQGYAEGLQECINDDEESRAFYCDVITDEAGKMNQMVQKLLTLNNLEFGNGTIEMTHFNITELIRGVCNSASILMKQSQITLEFDDTADVYVWGDEFQIEEVVTNYISNAIHHCDFEKKIRIFYTQKSDCIRVSVFNTGKQIPDEDLTKVWEKFFKVDKAHTRAYGGSGIGLSIVKAIMDSHHRECGVCNRENGVEFWFELDKNSVASEPKE